eukprot:CAMPEP_0172455512 /NCGR_PEP_ID=MMETSP1065-20121228/12102_1 /TAXON_ID=265537 /ORGANISM="Amphiprora paludosa, Strain CCMP125" /LENGTH=834 /DNA_ID=CAMNT_0013207973 /DNA_START=9 /DNA_END=2513 /DNA_ORIENTATION=+
MGRKRKSRQQPVQEHPPPREEVDSEDDEEIDEDEAFNSDDERKYGSFFSSNKKGDDDEGDDSEGGSDEEDEDLSEDEEEGEDDDDDDEEGSEDGDGGQYMLDLLDKLSGPSSTNADATSNQNTDSNRKLAAHVKESEHSSSVVKPAGLTLDSLMDSIKDTKGYGDLAKTMKHVATNQASAAPLPKVVKDRLERKVHYEKQSKSISGWTHVVQENRQAESLDFRPQDRPQVTKEMMVESFAPRTDFEKELDKALEEAGQKSEADILKAEEKALTDDLGANKITVEEFTKRRGQLAKMRALMFYHEQKRHHINKIKSKKYRRIRKRQRERLKEAEIAENPDIAEELREKEEVERIKERMTLAHKNTSKWAKRVLKRGKNVDVDTRRALSAQLKRGDDLLKKMKGDSDDEEDDSDEDLAESARKVLEDGDDGQEDGAVQGKGLFKLAFMQRGVEKARQKAKEEARQLLMELEADEREGESVSSDEEEDAPAKKKLRPASKKEMKEVLGEGDMVAAGLTFGNSTSLSVSGAIDVGMAKDSTSTVSEHQSSVAGAKAKAAETDPSIKQSKKSKSKQVVTEASAETNDEDESNPWMIDESESTKSKKKSRKQQRTMVNVDRAVEVMDAVDQQPPSAESSNKPKSKNTQVPALETNPESKTLTSLTQDELVRKAFAVDENLADEEFAQEKERVREQEENPTRKSAAVKAKDNLAQGWGSWTGMGAPAPPPPSKRKRLPKKLQPPELPPQRPRQDDKKPNVIVRERRMKQLSNTHMLQQIPHPYTSREEYERAMMGGIGKEWNVNGAFREMTQPAIVTQSGKIIQPIAATAKKRGLRPAAKF